MKRWLRRGGIALGVLVLLIVAFYVEENWRGARLWARTKAEYEAKGFNFDPKSLIPPPVPDEQNFAASELWKRLEQYKKTDGKENFKVALFTASATAQKSNPTKGGWLTGVKTPSPDPALFAEAQTELTALYASAERPFCRFNIDYAHRPAYSMPLPQASLLLNLAKALRWHALIQLDQGQTDIAAQDITICFRLGSASLDAPVLIMGLVGISTDLTAVSTLWEGIESHMWTDQQLAQFQTSMAAVNFLQAYTVSMQSELCFSWLPLLDTLEHHPNQLKALSPDTVKKESPILDRILQHGSNFSVVGLIFNSSFCYDRARYEAFDIFLQKLSPIVNVKDHRFFPERIPNLKKIGDRLSFNIPNLLLRLCIGGLPGTAEKFGEAQGRLDLAQVACGLERYWLVNKKYPATLAELEPQYINKIPHDLCTGEPLHYRVNGDGNYTLYSVGFNGVDDGGAVGMQKDSTTAIDPKQGDWVWPRSKK